MHDPRAFLLPSILCLLPAVAGADELDPAVAARAEAAIAALADPSHATRERAQAELLALGRPIVPLLRRAAGSADPEVAGRIEWLLLRLDVEVDGEGAALGAAVRLSEDAVGVGDEVVLSIVLRNLTDGPLRVDLESLRGTSHLAIVQGEGAARSFRALASGFGLGGGRSEQDLAPGTSRVVEVRLRLEENQGRLRLVHPDFGVSRPEPLLYVVDVEPGELTVVFTFDWRGSIVRRARLAIEPRPAGALEAAREAIVRAFRDEFLPSPAFQETFGRTWPEVASEVEADAAAFGDRPDDEAEERADGSWLYSGRIWDLHTEVEIGPGGEARRVEFEID